MKILILHRVPYFKIEYHRGISHDRHDVTYFGTDQALATLPPHLRCERVSRPGLGSAFEEARVPSRPAPACRTTPRSSRRTAASPSPPTWATG
ncbi:hypothetical protein ACWDE9_41050 [Streptomyces olivaceoviridis]